MDICTILQRVNGGFSSTERHLLSPAAGWGQRADKPTSLCNGGKLQESHEMEQSPTPHLIQEWSVEY